MAHTLFIILGFIIAVQATTRFISPQGTDFGDCTDAVTPCRSLRYTLFNVTKTGDTVKLDSGIYTGLDNWFLDWPDPQTLHGVKIIGSNTGETILDGEMQAYFFVFHCDLALTDPRIGVLEISHIKFTRATCIPHESAQHNDLGAVIFARDGCSISLSDCTFVDNVCNESLTNRTPRQSIISLEQSHIKLQRVSFINNENAFNGIVRSKKGRIDMEDCLFQNNTVGGQGSIWAEVTTVEMDNCKFINNTAPLTGGLRCLGTVVDSATIHLRNSEFINCENAVWLKFSDHTFIEGCMFKDNIKNAILAVGVLNTTVHDSTFVNNYGDQGGAIYLYPGDRTDELTVSDSMFMDNTAKWNGGSIYVENNVNMSVINSVFIGSTCSNNGGAINILNGNKKYVFRNSTFSKGKAGHQGGAISFSTGLTWSPAVVEVVDCLFEDNVVGEITDINIRGSGGAIFDKWYSVDYINSSFIGNEATFEGGAIKSFGSNQIISGCVFKDNTCPSGGGIHLRGSNNTVRSSFFEFNKGGAIYANPNADLFDNTFVRSSTYDLDGFFPSATNGNKFDVLHVPTTSFWDIEAELETSSLVLVGGVIRFLPGGSITITKSFEFSVDGVLTSNEGSLDEITKRDTLDEPDIILGSESVSEFNFRSLTIHNVTIENRGQLLITRELIHNFPFSPKYSHISNVPGSSLVAGFGVDIGGYDSVISFTNSSLVVNGPIEINTTTLFKNGSKVVMFIEEAFITWHVNPTVEGKLRVEVMRIVVTVGETFKVMNFTNKSNISNLEDKIDLVLITRRGEEFTKVTFSEGEIKALVIEKPRVLREWSSWSDISTIIIVILCAIGILATFSMAAIVLVFWRKSTILRAASREFLLVILFGLALSYAGAITWIAPVTSNALCELKVWIPLLGFVISLAPIISKTYRIKRIFSTKNLKIHLITFIEVVQITLAIIVIQFVILVMWTTTSRNKIERVIDPVDDDYELPQCKSKFGSVFVILTVVYEGGVLVVGAYFAFAVRNVPVMYNESKWMAAVIYNDLVWGVLLLIFGYTVTSPTSYATFSIVVSLGIWFITTITLGMMFLPKVTRMILRREIDDARPSRPSSTPSKPRIMLTGKRVIKTKSKSASSDGVKEGEEENNSLKQFVKQLEEKVEVLETELAKYQTDSSTSMKLHSNDSKNSI